MYDPAKYQTGNKYNPFITDEPEQEVEQPEAPGVDELKNNWNTIQKDPEWSTMHPEERQQVRDLWFKDNIEAHPEFNQFKPEEVPYLRREFFGDESQQQPQLLPEEHQGTQEETGIFNSALSVVGGGLLDTVKMYGQAGRALPGGVKAGQTGDGLSTGIIKGTHAIESAVPTLQHQQKEGFGRWLYEGARSAVTSLASGAPGMILGGALGTLVMPGAGTVGGMKIGTLLGAITGYALSGGTIFGLAEYDRFMEEGYRHNIENPHQKISEEELESAALESAFYEGGFEMITDIIEGATFKMGAALTIPAKATLKQGAKVLLGNSLKQTLGRMGTIAAAETGMEGATAYFQTDLRNRMGMTDQRAADALQEALGPALVASIIFGGISEAGLYRSRRKSTEALINPEVKPEHRISVINEIAETTAKIDPELAKIWKVNAYESVRQNKAIPLDEDMENLQMFQDHLEQQIAVLQDEYRNTKEGSPKQEQIAQQIQEQSIAREQIIQGMQQLITERQQDEEYNRQFDEEFEQRRSQAKPPQLEQEQELQEVPAPGQEVPEQQSRDALNREANQSQWDIESQLDQAEQMAGRGGQRTAPQAEIGQDYIHELTDEVSDSELEAMRMERAESESRGQRTAPQEEMGKEYDSILKERERKQAIKKDVESGWIKNPEKWADTPEGQQAIKRIQNLEAQKARLEKTKADKAKKKANEERLAKARAELNAIAETEYNRLMQSEQETRGTRTAPQVEIGDPGFIPRQRQAELQAMSDQEYGRLEQSETESRGTRDFREIQAQVRKKQNELSPIAKKIRNLRSRKGRLQNQVDKFDARNKGVRLNKAKQKIRDRLVRQVWKTGETVNSLQENYDSIAKEIEQLQDRNTVARRMETPAARPETRKENVWTPPTNREQTTQAEKKEQIKRYMKTGEVAPHVKANIISNVAGPLTEDIEFANNIEGLKDYIREVKVYGSYVRGEEKTNDIDIHVRIDPESFSTPEDHTSIYDAIEDILPRELAGKKLDVVVESSEQGMGAEQGKGFSIWKNPKPRMSKKQSPPDVSTQGAGQVQDAETAPAKTPKMQEAYKKVSKKAGFKNIEILALQKELNIPLEDLHAYIKENADKGIFQLTKGDYSLYSKEFIDAAVEVNGEKKMMIRFNDTEQSEQKQTPPVYKKGDQVKLNMFGREETGTVSEFKDGKYVIGLSPEQQKKYGHYDPLYVEKSKLTPATNPTVKESLTVEKPEIPKVVEEQKQEVKPEKTIKISSDAQNIRINKRKIGYDVRYDTHAYSDIMRLFFSKKLAEDYASGKEVDIVPGKGAEIPISENAKYAGQDEEWTERSTGRETLAETKTIYHFGSTGIKAFKPKETAFYLEMPERRTDFIDNFKGVYVAELPVGTDVIYYDDDELRVDLSLPGIKIYQAVKKQTQNIKITKAQKAKAAYDTFYSALTDEQKQTVDFIHNNGKKNYASKMLQMKKKLAAVEKKAKVETKKTEKQGAVSQQEKQEETNEKKDLETGQAEKEESKKVEQETQEEVKEYPIATDLQSFRDYFSRMYEGKTTPEELKSAFESFIENKNSIIAELSKLTKKKLLNTMSLMSQYQYKSEKKAAVVNGAYENMLSRFSFSNSLTYSPFEKGSYINAVRKNVEKTTQEEIQEHAAQVQKNTEEHIKRVEGYVKAVKNPETLEEFKTFIKVNGIDKLTPEQLESYDDLRAKEIKTVKAEKESTLKAVPDAKMKIIKGVHTKKGHDIWTVTLEERVGAETFRDLKKKAKSLGGYYSKYRGNGATPGFIFDNDESANTFSNLQDKDVSIEETAKKTTGRKQKKAADKLRTIANKLEKKATEKLNQDRTTNTARQARMAASAEADARADIAFAKTMTQIADAIESGNAEHLETVTQKVQIELLETLLVRAKNEALAKKFPDYQERQKRDRSPVKDDAAFAKLPRPRLDKQDLIDFAEAMGKVKSGGTLKKQFESRVRKVTDRTGKSTDWYDFKEHEIDILDRAVKKIKEYNKTVSRSSNQIYLTWRVEDSIANRKRLARMGIKTDEQLRAALRELVDTRTETQKEDPVKKLERELIGRKDIGIDFFPTPKPLVERMVADAHITEDMKILEPSAGNGYIADGIKEQHPEADIDTVEMSSTLRKILDAKGYNIAGQDFMQYEAAEYDRILMNPPFSKGRDAEHIKHAYGLLKPNGKLIAIMGEHAFFANDKKSQDFRDWLQEVGGESEQLQGAFLDKTALNKTGVASRYVVIDKGESDVTATEAEQDHFLDVGKKGELTNKEINETSDNGIKSALVAIKEDYYRGLSPVQKDVIRKYESRKEFERDEAESVVKAYRDYWIEREQSEKEAERKTDSNNEKKYGKLTIDELKIKLNEINSEIDKLQAAGKNEMTDAGRRTSAAVSNEAARNLGTEKLKLERYIKEKKEAKEEQFLAEIEYKGKQYRKIAEGSVNGEPSGIWDFKINGEWKQVKNYNLRETLDNELTGQQAEFPLKRVERAYNHTSLNPANAAKAEQESFDSAVKALQTEMERDVPEDRENEIPGAIEKFKADYINEREKVWSARDNAYSVTVAGASKFNKKQAGKRNNAVDNAEAEFAKWLQKTESKISDELGATAVRADAKLEKYKKKQESDKLVKEGLVKKWMELKPGDKVNIGNDSPITIKKKNQFSIVSEGLETKWTLKELWGVDHAEARKIIKGLKADEKTEANLKPQETGVETVKVKDAEIEITETKAGDKKVEVDMPKEQEEALKPKEQKAYLLEEIDAVIDNAPELEGQTAARELIDAKERIKRLERIDAEEVTRADKAELDNLKESLSELEKELEQEKAGSIIFDVPGDGKFVIPNNKTSLQAFKKNVKSRFPSVVPKFKHISAPKAGKPADRITGFAGEAVRDKYESRRRLKPIERTDSKTVYYKNGYYSNGTYLIKTEKPSISKKVEWAKEENTPDIKKHIDIFSKNIEPAEIGREWYVAPTDDPYTWFVEVKAGKDIKYFNPVFFDHILTKHPDAEIFLHKDGAAVFMKNNKVVGAVMGIMDDTLPTAPERSNPKKDKFYRDDVKYSTQTNKAGTPQEITLADLQKAVGKGVKVNPKGDNKYQLSFNKDRSPLTLEIVDHIPIDPAAFERQEGRSPTQAELKTGAAGMYVNGVMQVSRQGDQFTVSHELMHGLVESGVITFSDFRALVKASGQNIAKLSRANMAEYEEGAAKWFEDFRKGQAEAKGRLAQIAQKIMDFVDRLVNLVARTGKGVARDIESGRIFENTEQGEQTETKAETKNIPIEKYSIPEGAKPSLFQEAKEHMIAAYKAISGNKFFKPGSMLYQTFVSPEYFKGKGKEVVKARMAQTTMREEMFYRLDKHGDKSLVKEMTALMNEGKSYYEREISSSVLYDLQNDKSLSAKAKQFALVDLDITINELSWEEYDKTGLDPQVIKIHDMLDETYKGYFDMLSLDVKTLYEQYKNEGREMPEIDRFVNEAGKTEIVTLATLYHAMGDMRGKYRPRVWEQGTHEIYSKDKDGTIWRTPARDARDAWVKHAELKRKGHTGTMEGQTKIPAPREVKKFSENIWSDLSLGKTAKLIEEAINESDIAAKEKAALKMEVLRQVSDQYKSRAFRSHKIGRKHKGGAIVRGFIENPLAVYTMYGNRVAGGIAKGISAANMFEILNGKYKKYTREGARWVLRDSEGVEIDNQKVEPEDDQKKFRQKVTREGEHWVLKNDSGEIVYKEPLQDFEKQYSNEWKTPYIQFTRDNDQWVLRNNNGKIVFTRPMTEAERNRQKMMRHGGLDPKTAEQRMEYDMLNKYATEQLKNPGETDRLISLIKGFVSMKYLTSPKSALVNTTAVITTVPAAILKFVYNGNGSFIKIGNALQKAGRDYAGVMVGRHLRDPDDQEFIQIIRDRFYDKPQFMQEAFGTVASAQGKMWGNIMEKSFKMFSTTEQWNRGTTMLAGYRLAKKEHPDMKQKDIIDLVIEMSDRAHGQYHRGTNPMVAMGDNPAAKIAQMGYTYQKFGHNWVQFTGELWGPQFKPQNGKAVAWMLLSPGVLGGMASMAALTPAWMLGTAILAALGDDRDPEKFVYDHLREMLGERGEEIARYGAFGAMGLDISGSLGIRVGVPTNIKDLTGPFGGVWDDVNQAFRYFRAGQAGRAAEQMLPALLRYPAKAIRELDGATTSRGNKIFDKHGNPYIPGVAESVLQAFGARSSRRAAIQARGWETKKQAYNFKNKKQMIYEEYKAYLFKPEAKKLKRIADKIDDFNRSVVEGRIEGITPITRKSLQSVIRHWNK